ncbi:integrase/recombinase XerD [Mucilaginibacter sp. UYP25]|uniref:tyrosine-type recombinase/integrase n=1 Tax=unclassified Mucilaginibacter TaxID=2617802 RepID=UPI0033917B62
MAVKVNLYLDERKVETGKKAPVKIRLYISRTDIRHYPTDIHLTAQQFQQSYLTEKPKKAFQEIKISLSAIEARANKIITKMDGLFILDKFEREMFRSQASTTDVCAYYQDYIDELTRYGRAGTASNYRLSLKSILEFAGKDNRPASSLAFSRVTVDFLNRYENWMVAANKSKTTVGIYLRPLRAIFNKAIEEGSVAAELYPFKKYKIPTGQNIKKALSKDELKKLYTAPVEPGSPKEKARDFWFFSYQCNGMNFRDIAELKYKNINKKSISFLRHKTLHTTKDKPRPIIIPLTETIKAIIERYGTRPFLPDNYVFPILTKKMDEAEKLRVNQNFIRFVNQHIQNLAKDLELDADISTYYARHSFTTAAIRNGAKMELIQESLGHRSLNTTQNYWAGFEDNVKQEIADKLMDFG